MVKRFVLLGMIGLGSLIPASAQTTLFHCSSFAATGACSATKSGYSGNFLVRNGGDLSGSVIDFVPANSGHNGYGLAYYNQVNVQSFVTSFTFIPNGQNIAFVVQNTNDTPGYEGNAFSSGAGCEGGFYQAFNTGTVPSPNNLFALEFDSGGWLTNASQAFTYSSVQIYQANQSPCLPNDSGPNFVPISKVSTYPVPLNSPVDAQYKTTGHVYSATVSYDGSTVSLSLYDVDAGGSCPGSSCFTQSWPGVNIPSLVNGNTAYIGFAAGINIPNLPTLWVHSWNFTDGTSTQAATPTISPAAGSYANTQSVALSSTSSGAIICYNTSGAPATDGGTGCATGTLYSGSIPVSSSETLFAVAGGAGLADSAVASAAYTIGSTTVATPTFSPAAGTYSAVQPVNISDATSGATIYYTTDGSAPTTSSTRYTGAIAVNSTETLKAMAAAAGDSSSAVASAVYNINLTLPATATPAISPAAGTYSSAQSVTLSDSTSGATIYYTTNGSTPTPSSTEYSGPITVGSTETLKAMAVATGDSSSAIASAAYTIDLSLPAAATPSFSVASGTYTSAQSVTISDATSDATIYYTTNGSQPTTSSLEYAGPISVRSTETLHAIAVASGDSNSAVATAAYTIGSGLPSAAAPTFSPASGAYTSAQSVTLSDSTSGATIYYTVNGSVPTPSSTVYAGAITVNSTETLEAIAVAAGDSNSAVTSSSYTIGAVLPTVATPTFSPAAGTYNAAQSVTVADATSGATIYYTTDGTAPTTSSSAYTGPIAVSATETLQAIAAASGNSAVASAAYTITTQPNFMLATSVNSLAINSGGQGTLMVTVTPENGFSAPVVLACAGLPAWATCSFGESTVTPSGGSATTQLIITSNPQAAALPPVSNPGSRTLFPFTTLAMTVGLFGWRKRRGWGHWLLLAIAYGGLGLLFGCSSTSGSSAISPSNQSSTVTVTAISGSLQGSAAIAVTVN